MTKAATCIKCQCTYSPTWGEHHCLENLPPLPKEFEQQRKIKGELMAKCDYHDRRAWLEHVTMFQGLSLDATKVHINGKLWQQRAAEYRAEAEARLTQAKIDAEVNRVLGASVE